MIRDRTGHRVDVLWLLRGAFLLIIVGFVVINAAFWLVQRENRDRDRRLVDETLASAELLTRLTRDVVEKQRLIDEHVLEPHDGAFGPIEERILAHDSDFRLASKQYDALATLPEERAAWTSLQNAAESVRPAVETALALSRQDRDAEARAVMAGIEPRFDEIEQLFDTLVRLNRITGERDIARVRADERRAMLVIGSVGLGGAALALALSAWVTQAMKRRDTAIRRGVERLEARNRELDAFAGRVAHDLRGPLTTISLSADQLLERAPAVEGTILVLRRGIDRMERMIEDLLALSRVSAQVPSALAPVSDVVQELAQDLRPHVESTGGSIQLDVAQANVKCSPGLLRQALTILGENAARYRRQDVPLRLNVVGKRTRQFYELRLEDNGRGMSAGEVRRAFEPFFRAEPDVAQPGSGLGLSIVKRIVESSGGEVRIESRQGQGTAFILELPYA